MPWNLRLGAVYGPDRRPCPLWPLVVFPDDVDRKIAELLKPQPRLPTPQYFAQLNFSPPHRWALRKPEETWDQGLQEAQVGTEPESGGDWARLRLAL